MSQPKLEVVSLRPGHKPPEAAALETAECPEWLSEFGKETWLRLAPQYQLGPTDVDEFAAFCEAVAEFREATEVISEAGLLVIDPQTAMPVPNPITGVRDRADKKLAYWAGRFKST